MLSQLRLCVEKPLAKDEKKLQDVCKDCTSNAEAQRQRAVFLKAKLWPSTDSKGNPTTITVSFVSEGKKVKWTPMKKLMDTRNDKGDLIPIDPLEKILNGKSKPIDAVKRVVNDRIVPLIGMRIKFVSKDGDIRIDFDPKGGAYSLLGIDCLDRSQKVTMNLGWLDVGTIVHEFMHAFGAIHEHQNPRGSGIDWDVPKVIEWANETQGWSKSTTERNIIERYDIDQTNGSVYDPESVMLYFFPSSLTKNNKGTNQNFRMSLTDMIWLSRIYPGGKEDPNEFHNRIYSSPQSIQNENKSSSSKSVWWYVILFVIIFIVCVIVYIIWSVIKVQYKKEYGYGYGYEYRNGYETGSVPWRNVYRLRD